MIKIADFTDYAQEVLPKEVFEYFSGGAGEEITLRENEKIYDQIKLNYRVLKGINEIDLNTTNFRTKNRFTSNNRSYGFP